MSDDTQQEQETQETSADERGNRLWGLMTVLQGQKFEAELVDGDTLRVSSAERPGLKVDVRCAPRASDGGRLWFFVGDGEPLAEADHITDAVVAIKGRTAVRM